MRSVSIALRLLIFFLTFSLEVRVRADELRLEDAKFVQQQPDGCWEKSENPCAVKTRAGERASLKLSDATLVLDESTVVARVGGSEIRLMTGQVWLRSSEPSRVRTEFGTFANEKSEAPSEFWVVREASGRVVASAVSGKVLMAPRGTVTVLEIPEGLENWLARVDVGTGVARTGIPTPIVFKEHMKRWARLFRGNKAEFEKEAQAFHQAWTEAAKEAAELHQKLFDRKVAGVEAEEKKRATSLKSKDTENARLREIFRQRVFDQ